MSKVVCECGHVLSDNTDYISYKARFIADQDFFDFLDEEEKAHKQGQQIYTGHYFGEIFQCPDCSNLIVFSADNERRLDFQPLNKEKSERMTLSYLGDKWKGNLFGHYYSTHPLEYKRNRGELYWFTNKEQGYLTDMTLEDLLKAYYNKKEELISIN